MPNKYKEGDMTSILTGFNVSSEDEDVTIRKPIAISWSAKSNLCKLLNIINKMPAPRTTFDPDTLIGSTLMVSVKNNEVDGRTYSNIEDFFPLNPTKKTKPSNPQPQVDDDGDDEDAFVPTSKSKTSAQQPAKQPQKSSNFSFTDLFSDDEDEDED